MIFASFYQFLVHFQSSLHTLKQDAGVWTLLTEFVFPGDHRAANSTREVRQSGVPLSAQGGRRGGPRKTHLYGYDLRKQFPTTPPSTFPPFDFRSRELTSGGLNGESAITTAWDDPDRTFPLSHHRKRHMQKLSSFSYLNVIYNRNKISHLMRRDNGFKVINTL